jgi:hypothetical protein
LKVVVREYWPGVSTGEKETIERISLAFAILGIECVKVPVGLDDDEIIKELDPLFVLDLHFDAPRITSTTSVAALWNPIDYYTVWGGANPLSNQLHHDYFVAANPVRASEWLEILAPEYEGKIPILSHSVPSTSIRKPATQPTGKVFYAGIGWDRSAVSGHRHEAMFRALDKFDILELYGPSVLGDGTKPWAGFVNYKGELPFDGTALFDKVNELGFGLCFSSPSHQASGIPTNRVFETIAAGSIPIVEHGIWFPFDISEAIAVPEGFGTEQAARFIAAEVKRLSSNTGELESRVNSLQTKLRNGFTLDYQLAEIVDYISSNKASLGNLISEKKVASGYSLLADDNQEWASGISALSSNPLQHSQNLFRKIAQETTPLPEWIVFTKDQEFIQSLNKSLGSTTFDNLDVIHVPGRWVANGINRFISQQWVQSNVRTVDSVVFRASLLEEWIKNSNGLASLGSLLLALSEDFNTPKGQILRHGILKNVNFTLKLSNPTHMSAFSSNLDAPVLKGMAAVSGINSRSASLASLALSNINKSATLDNRNSVLAALADEVTSIGLQRVLRQGLNYLRRSMQARRRKRS